MIPAYPYKTLFSLSVTLLDRLAAVPNRSEFMRDAMARGFAGGVTGVRRPSLKGTATRVTSICVSPELHTQLSVLTAKQSRTAFAEICFEQALDARQKTEASAARKEARAIAKFRSLITEFRDTKKPTQLKDSTRISLLLPTPLLAQLCAMSGMPTWVRSVLACGVKAGVVGKRRCTGDAVGYKSITVTVPAALAAKLRASPAGMQAIAEHCLTLAMEMRDGL